MRFCFPKLWIECTLFSLSYRIEFVTYIKVLNYFKHCLEQYCKISPVCYESLNPTIVKQPWLQEFLLEISLRGCHWLLFSVDSENLYGL